MPNWTQHLAAKARRWHVEARINGIGLPLSDVDLATTANDARLRWCAFVPPWAAATNAPTLWQPLLAEPLPPLLGEVPDILGGMPKYPAGMSVFISDVLRRFGQRIKPDARGVSLLAEDLDDADTSLSVGPELVPGQVYWLESEAFRVESGGAGTFLVTRGFFNTKVVAHTNGLEIYDVCHQLLATGIEFWAGPLHGSQADMQKLVVATIIDAPTTPGQWELKAECNAAEFFAQRTPATARTITITKFFPNQTFNGTVLGPAIPPQHESVGGFVLQWVGGQLPTAGEPLLYAQTDKGEVIGLTFATNGQLQVMARDLLGLGGFDDLKEGTVLTQVFFGNSWRYSGAADGPAHDSVTGMRAGSGWNPSTHVCDLFLTIATSPANPLDAAGNNYSAEGNWSVLPGGYGLDIPITDINVASFTDIKTRRPDLLMEYALWGAETRPASEVIDEMFRAAGIHLHVGAQISASMAHMPLATTDLPVIDGSVIIGDRNDRLITTPRIINAHLARARFGTVRVLVGPRQEKTKIYARGPDNVDIPMPWVRNAAPFISRLIAVINLLSRDAWEFEVAVSPATFFQLTDGASATYDFPFPGNLRDDTNPSPARQARVLSLQLKQEMPDGVTASLLLRLYPQYMVSSLISPCALVVVIVNATTFHTSSYNYCLNGGPTIDGDKFVAGDVVALYNGDGTRVGALTETFTSFTDPSIVLSGNFGGSILAGMHIGFPPFDEMDTDHQAVYLCLSSMSGMGPSDADPTALPFVWGEQ